MQKNLLWTIVAALLVCSVGCGPREVGMIVVYEVDTDKIPLKTEITVAEMQRLSAAIDRRLTQGWQKLGRCRQLDAERIEVSIFRADVKEMQRIADLLSRSGTLEFRILANRNDHPTLIESAQDSDAQFVYMLDADGEPVRNEDGEPILRGWWVPLGEGSSEVIPDYPEIATRTRQVGERTITEVLVVKDPYDVTGDYLVRCVPSVDQSGRPSVTFRFNARGGRLFAGLTGDNLPDQAVQFTRKLGIILDGYLFSAPSIQSQIGERGEITGNFSRQEVEDMVDVLNAGALPFPIRQVEQRIVGSDTTTTSS